LPIQGNFLESVTCLSTSDCWAVGESLPNFAQTLIEHWDGTIWSIVSSPNATTQDNYLHRVTCLSTSDCWAAGYAHPDYTQTLVEHWDGSAWTIVGSPNVGTTDYNFFNDLTCASSSDCWAVGYSYHYGRPPDVSTPPKTLIEHWNGSFWAIVSSPNGGLNNDLHGVTCASSSDCWTVGAFSNRNIAQTLTEHFSPMTPTGVVSRKIHGGVSTFDVNLPLAGNPGIECRSGGATGDYTLVFTFANTLASVSSTTVTSGSASVVSNNIDSSDAHNYIVNLTGVTNAQYITVSLANVTDSAGNFSSAVSATMGVLIGDVNASKLVDGNDVSAVQSHTRQSVNDTNFRYDVNTSGLIDGNDVSITQAQTRTSLP
jgi:hypothetical protein